MRPEFRPALLIPALAAGLLGCQRRDAADARGAGAHSLKVEAYDEPVSAAPAGPGKLRTLPPLPAPAVAAPSTSDAAPLELKARPDPDGRPAGWRPAVRALALPDPEPQGAPSGPAPASRPAEPGGEAAAQPGFHITLPICRRAASQNDPLADTPECRQILAAAHDQAKACAEAFERGDDDAVLSAACRQAAKAR